MLNVFGLLCDANGSAHVVEKERGHQHRNLDNIMAERAFNLRGPGLNGALTIADEDPQLQIDALREVFV